MRRQPVLANGVAAKISQGFQRKPLSVSGFQIQSDFLGMLSAPQLSPCEELSVWKS